MAHPNMYMQQAQGTLVAGQIIAVNKYTVQVERFLSQGSCSQLCCHIPSDLALALQAVSPMSILFERLNQSSIRLIMS